MVPKNESDGQDSDVDSTFSSVSHDSMPAIEAYGHKYHGSGRIWVPMDESFIRLATIEHKLCKVILKDRLTDTKLPIEDIHFKPEDGQPFAVLDVGSGSGTWAVEMARHYPQAEVLGIDLTSALLPTDVPQNLTFEIADAEEHLPPKLFDFIHMRNLVGGGIRDWEGLMQRALKHLKPGGQLEFTAWRPLLFDRHDTGYQTMEFPEVNPSALEFIDAVTSKAAEEDVDLDPGIRVTNWLSTCNEVTGVRKTVHFIPFQSRAGSAPDRQKAELANALLDLTFENYGLAFAIKSGIDEKRARQLMQAAIDVTRDYVNKIYNQVVFITAVKRG